MDARWEPLGKALRVLTAPGQGFSTDTLLLADFSMPKGKAACADLGCGCGVIPLLWGYRSSPRSILALDMQGEAIELLRESIRDNGMEGLITPIEGDVRNYKGVLPHQSLDLIASNPPYFPPGSGAVSRDPRREAARHSGTFLLPDLALAARHALKHGGRLCLCLPVQRLAEGIAVFKGQSLEPKRLRLVQQGPGKEPYLALLECRKGGGSGLRVMENLFITDGSGGYNGYSREMERIYGDYLKDYQQTGSRKEQADA